MVIGSNTFVVPLNFLGITAERTDRGAHITWNTVNEVDVSHYEVERADGTGTFTVAGRVPARNTGDLETYHFDDAPVPAGRLHYRIRGVDLDGSARYTRVVTLAAEGRAESFTVLANPATGGRISVGTSLSVPGTVQARLVSLSGQVLAQADIAYNGSGMFQVPYTHLPAGIYVLHLQTGELSFRQKVMIR
jgi:hypothetical protein